MSEQKTFYKCSFDGTYMISSNLHRAKDGYRYIYCPKCFIVRKIEGDTEREKRTRQTVEARKKRRGPGIRLEPEKKKYDRIFSNKISEKLKEQLDEEGKLW